MNRLQKKAWINLAAVATCTVLNGIILGALVHLNTKGIHLVSLVAGLVAGLIGGLIVYIRSIAEETGLDERERAIARKSFVWASYSFSLFWAIASFGIFFVVGGKCVVHAYVFPVVFLTALFLAQFVESAAILIQFAREMADE